MTDPPRPQDFEFLINGKKQKLTSLVTGDTYIPIPAGDLQAEARWSPDATGSGYSVVITTAEPDRKTRATCTTGTTWRVPEAVPIERDQEMSWEVHVVTNEGQHVVDGFKVCLVGRKA